MNLPGIEKAPFTFHISIVTHFFFFGACHERVFLSLQSLGATVIIAARKQDQLTRTAHEIQLLGGKCDTMTINIRDPAQAQQLVEQIVTKHGKLDALVVLQFFFMWMLMMGSLQEKKKKNSPKRISDTHPRRRFGIRTMQADSFMHPLPKYRPMGLPRSWIST